MLFKNVFLLIVFVVLWGVFFLFIWIGVVDFGVVLLMVLCVGIGVLFFVGFVLMCFKLVDFGVWLCCYVWLLFVVGVLNFGILFCLFVFVELMLLVGVMLVINVIMLLWGVFVVYLWLKDKLLLLCVFGFVIGFVGVFMFVWN